MTRTREYWNSQVATALAALSLSSSAAALWKLLRDICVTLAMTLDGIWQLFQSEINLSLATKQPGTLGWYSAISLAFQYGDSLVVTNGVLGYAVDDAAKRIVVKASVAEADEDLLLVKLAKLSGAALAPLSSPELTAFKTYLSARRIPGVKVNAVSYAADVIYYEIEVLYDARVDQTTLDTAIKAALAAYRDALPFNAIVFKSKLLEAVLQVDGVVNATAHLDVSYSSGGSVVDFYDFTELPAGYFNYDGSSPIFYTPQ